MKPLPRRPFVQEKLTRHASRGLALLLLGACLACDSAPTPTPIALPTVPPPQVQRAVTEVPPTATPPPPSPAQLDAVAALLDRWAFGDVALGSGVASQPMGRTAAGDFTALALQRAPVLTPTAGVQIEPAVLVADSAGKARALAFAVGSNGDTLVPEQVVWAEHGAAAAILYTWRTSGRLIDNRPFVLLDATGARRGPVLWTLAPATPPAWSPDGGLVVYLDGGSAGPRMSIADDQGRLRVGGPAANLECARCWPDGLWAPSGGRWAYTTAQTLATPDPLGTLTWRLVVLDGTAGRVLFDQAGPVVGVAQVVRWTDPAQVQVVVRRPLVPATQITGTQGNWVDTPYILRLDPAPPRLEPAP